MMGATYHFMTLGLVHGMGATFTLVALSWVPDGCHKGASFTFTKLSSCVPHHVMGMKSMGATDHNLTTYMGAITVVGATFTLVALVVRGTLAVRQTG
jgi:hypothetical protein